MQTSYFPKTRNRNAIKRPEACCFIQDPFLLRRMELFCKNSGFNFTKMTMSSNISNEVQADLWIVNTLLHFQLIETKLRHSNRHSILVFVNSEKIIPNFEVKHKNFEVLVVNSPDFPQKNGSIKMFDSLFKNILIQALQQDVSNLLPSCIQQGSPQSILRDYDQVSLQSCLHKLGLNSSLNDIYLESDGTYLKCNLKITKHNPSNSVEKNLLKNKVGNLTLIAGIFNLEPTQRSRALQSITLLFKWSSSFHQSEFKTLKNFAPILIQKYRLSPDPSEEKSNE